MNKTYLFTLIVLFFNLISAQKKQILVEYEHTRPNINTKVTLIAREDKALYITDSILIENEKNVKFDKSVNKIEITPRKTELPAVKYYTNINNNILLFTTGKKKKQRLVKDVLPDFNWNISESETKKIGNFICRKATTNFRGSEIIAWYSEELSIPYGPWKFKNLPGLILELYNDSSTYHWKATKIIYPYNKKISYEVDKSLEIISTKKLVLERVNMIKRRMKRINSRAPKGTTIHEGKITRDGLEKKYEWEN